MKAIHTKTQEEFNRVLEIFEEKGWTWCNGDKPTKLKDQWKKRKSETCIRYEDESFFADKEFYKDEGYTIISFEDFLKEEGIEEWNEGEEVYISSLSEEDALKYRDKRILLRKCNNGFVCIEGLYEEDYKKGDAFYATHRKYAVKVPKEKKELTLQEIADKFEIAVEDLKIKK